MAAAEDSLAARSPAGARRGGGHRLHAVPGGRLAGGRSAARRRRAALSGHHAEHPEGRRPPNREQPRARRLSRILLRRAEARLPAARVRRPDLFDPRSRPPCGDRAGICRRRLSRRGGVPRAGGGDRHGASVAGSVRAHRERVGRLVRLGDVGAHRALLLPGVLRLPRRTWRDAHAVRGAPADIGRRTGPGHRLWTMAGLGNCAGAAAVASHALCAHRAVARSCDCAAAAGRSPRPMAERAAVRPGPGGERDRMVCLLPRCVWHLQSRGAVRHVHPDCSGEHPDGAAGAVPGSAVRPSAERAGVRGGPDGHGAARAAAMAAGAGVVDDSPGVPAVLVRVSHVVGRQQHAGALRCTRAAAARAAGGLRLGAGQEAGDPRICAGAPAHQHLPHHHCDVGRSRRARLQLPRRLLTPRRVDEPVRRPSAGTADVLPAVAGCCRAPGIDLGRRIHRGLACGLEGSRAGCSGSVGARRPRGGCNGRRDRGVEARSRARLDPRYGRPQPARALRQPPAPRCGESSDLAGLPRGRHDHAHRPLDSRPAADRLGALAAARSQPASCRDVPPAGPAGMAARIRVRIARRGAQCPSDSVVAAGRAVGRPDRAGPARTGRVFGDRDLRRAARFRRRTARQTRAAGAETADARAHRPARASGGAV